MWEASNSPRHMISRFPLIIQYKDNVLPQQELWRYDGRKIDKLVAFLYHIILTGLAL